MIESKLVLKSGKSKAAQTLSWPWTLKEINKLLETIELEKTTVILAIQTDANECTLQIQTTLEEVRNSMQEMKHDKEFQDVIKWLSTIDPSSNHERARKKHEPGTGKWFLNSMTFQHWSTKAGSSVWLYGIPGVGQTILCSTILESVKNLCNSSGKEYAYFYFDFNDSRKRVPGNMLCSVIAQLCVQRKQYPLNWLSYIYRTEWAEKQQLSIKL